jgi:hypothetical protein
MGVISPHLVYRTWSTAKLITKASASEPPERLRIVITQLPAVLLEIQQLYAPAVAPDETLRITTSLALIVLLVKVNETFVMLANEAPFSVI